MPAVSSVYASFLFVSLLVLFLVFCVKTPELWRSGLRFWRQLVARRTRNERMLADLERLMAEARRLEGIYCFDGVEPHVSPAIGGKAVSAVGREAAPVDKPARLPG